MDRTTLLLGQEELLFALRASGEGHLPGMGTLEMEQTDAQATELLTQAGGRALLARNLLVRNDAGTPLLDKGLYALLKLCAHPQQMVSLFTTGKQIAKRQTFYYRVDELAATHTPQPDGIHKFELSATSDLGAADMAHLLTGLPPSEATIVAQPISQEALNQADALARTNQPAASATLVAAGMPLSAATAFAQTLATPDLSLVAQVIWQFSPTVEQQIAKLIAGPGGCWLVTATRLNAEQPMVACLPSAGVQEALLQPLEALNAQC